VIIKLLFVIIAGTENVILLLDVLTALTRLLLEMLKAPAFFGKQAKKRESLSA
jgi:hypothetical protein